MQHKVMRAEGMGARLEKLPAGESDLRGMPAQENGMPAGGVDYESKNVLRALTSAHKRLAELRGLCSLLAQPNLPPRLPKLETLAQLLLRQEAVDCLAIEGMGCDYERVLQGELLGKSAQSQAERALAAYFSAVTRGISLMRKEGGFLSEAHLQLLQGRMMNEAGHYRTGGGGVVENSQTGEVVYEPPQDPQEVRDLMANFMSFMKDEKSLDPLVKMAILHHQFECIRPFASGNGRMGRLLNMLYLVQQEMLEAPVLMLSGYFRAHRDEYYRLLRHARIEGAWEDWILYFLRGIEEQARASSVIIWEVTILMRKCEVRLKRQWPKLARPMLLQNLFAHPYTNIDLLMRDLGISRLTAAKYLRLLSQGPRPLLHLQRAGRNNFYINRPLVELFPKVATH